MHLIVQTGIVFQSAFHVESYDGTVIFIVKISTNINTISTNSNVIMELIFCLNCVNIWSVCIEYLLFSVLYFLI